MSYTAASRKSEGCRTFRLKSLCLTVSSWQWLALFSWNILHPSPFLDAQIIAKVLVFGRIQYGYKLYNFSAPPIPSNNALHTECTIKTYIHDDEWIAIFPIRWYPPFTFGCIDWVIQVLVTYQYLDHSRSQGLYMRVSCLLGLISISTFDVIAHHQYGRREQSEILADESWENNERGERILFLQCKSSRKGQ